MNLKKVAVSNFPGELFIPALGSISVDSNGNVFAFAGMQNRSGCFIVKLDPNLKFLKKFGRDGKGPGEFTTNSNPGKNRITIDNKGNVYISDSMPYRLLFFKNNGDYIKEINITRDYQELLGYPQKIGALDEQTFVSQSYILKGALRNAYLFDLNKKRILTEYNYRGKDIRMIGISYTWFCFGFNYFLDTDAESLQFLIADSQEFRVRLYDKNGNLKLEIFDKDRKMSTFNDREISMIKKCRRRKENEIYISNNFLANPNSDKEKHLELVEIIRKSKNVIADARLSGDRIFVFPVSDDITVEEHYPMEIYNLKGKLLKKTYVKKIPDKIWKSYFYYSEINEEEEPCIIKYSVLDIF